MKNTNETPPWVKGAAITHRGVVRKGNEDALLFGHPYFNTMQAQPVCLDRPMGSPWVVAVADGLGAANAGEIASQLVVETLHQAGDVTPAGITRLLCDLNRKIYEMGQAKPVLQGMGATVAGLASGPEGLFAFNVGDSRLYRRQARLLAQITRDDSVAQLLEDAGMNAMDATTGHRCNMVTQAVGGQLYPGEIQPHIYPLRIVQETRFLICTDGLTDMLALEALEATVIEFLDPREAVMSLCEKACAAGGRDNITIALVDVTPGSTQR